ncbi:MAG: hypothetical protein JNK64_25830 [Myxococcales bacterium]|nr:hypothetical protein [Myxococcales bacterium]
MATDRLLPICDLLMAAAHADGRLDQREADVVRELLADLVDGALPPTVDARIASFDPKRFTLATAAAAFRGDPLDERKRLLYLVDAVQEADDELDLAESSFLAALAKALEVPADAVAGLTLEVEVEELKQALATVRRGPPPIPGRAGDAVDVDLD